MSRYAGKVLKRLGDTEKAYSCYLEEAAKCDPPLDDSELQTIWNSAKRFYKKVSAQKGYIPPDEYGNAETLKPGDYSDVGQASVLAVEYHDILRYSPYTEKVLTDCRVKTVLTVKMARMEKTERTAEMVWTESLLICRNIHQLLLLN